jgi:ABC-2 type transport system permease protein
MIMKVVDIAIKDITHSFRSAFALIFMFFIPIAVTTLFYFMFGNITSGGGFSVPKTKVILVNLDKGGSQFQAGMANLPGGMRLDSLGDVVVTALQSPTFSSLLEVSTSPDAANARTAVDKQKAGVAIIIPEDFSAAFADLTRQAEIELYQDPTLTLGPAIVKSILDQFLDSISGAKIAVGVAMEQSPSADPTLMGKILQQYMAASSGQNQSPEALLDIHLPAKAEESNSPLLGIITTIMGGMMVFYAFYTGSAAAQSILQEDESGTLPRLFTTPTSHSTILWGKFLAVGLTVVIQMTTLLVFARLVFGIRWGAPLPVALATIGTMATSTTMGIFINSLLKSTKVAGTVFGGLLTITGMIGMLPVFTQGSPNTPEALKTVSLLVPQGWAIQGLFQAVNGEALTNLLTSLLVLLALSAVFFTVGVWRFQKRYA